MKTIIALSGAANRGKSTTLRLLIEKIKAKYPTAGIEEKLFKIDITIILTINGVKVGIETQGDPNSRLGTSLARFVENKCKVIICASRSYGGTVDLVHTAANAGYEVKWVDKIKVDPREHGRANATMAEELFRAFQKALLS
ncbi:hypothetical protein [Roseateles chitinivorans]|uniref:hypothetical protein n=1 Tax=Roseateles chitinivorans TaxID=2917965 RepID=UPI003D67B932